MWILFYRALILSYRGLILSYRGLILSVLSFNFNSLSVWDIFIFSLNKSSILIERAIFRVIFILVLKCSRLSATRCIKENSVNKSYAWCVYPLISISFVCYTIRFKLIDHLNIQKNIYDVFHIYLEQELYFHWDRYD